MAIELVPRPSLAERTTLRLGGNALAQASFDAVSDLELLPDVIEAQGGAPVVLGGGSNTLAMGGELGVVLLHCAIAGEPEVIGEDAGGVLLKVNAGVLLPKLLAWAERNHLTGLEGLTGIPGSVGGATAMNAGSWGTEIGDTLRRVRIWTPEGGSRWLGRHDYECRYREFQPHGVTGFWLVTAVEVALERGDQEAIKQAMRGYMIKKKSRQPVTKHSAGCVFKNPVGDSAGLLLDRAGYRGKRLGGVAFSEMHANFLVNDRKGTSEQAVELITEARQAVLDTFGVALDMEVKVVGEGGETSLFPDKEGA
jgi:UDP-N-acetylmuramate dehydrogenase